MTLSYRFKIGFDAVMLAILAAVYCANPTGLSFHEWAGLGIYVLFIAHLAYNYRWIAGVGKRLFDRAFGTRAKVLYVTDLLLLAAFVLIGLSGVMISHKIFSFGIMALWRPMHSIASAVSVILLALHTGLHGAMILNFFKHKAARIVAVIVLAAMLAAGVYGVVEAKRQTAAGERARYETVIGLFERSVSLLNGPPAYVRARQSSGGGKPEGGAAESAGRPAAVFNPVTLLVSVSSYGAFIIAGAALVFVIDRNRKRRKR